MKTFSMRAFPENRTLVWGIVITYLAVVLVVVVIFLMNQDQQSARTARLLVTLILIPLLAPLFGILWLLSWPVTVSIGNGQLVVWDRKRGQLVMRLTDIGHARVVDQSRRLEIYDHSRVLRFRVTPFLKAKVPDELLSWLQATMPHRATEQRRVAPRASFVDRFVDFPPPGMY